MELLCAARLDYIKDDIFGALVRIPQLSVRRQQLLYIPKSDSQWTVDLEARADRSIRKVSDCAAQRSSRIVVGLTQTVYKGGIRRL